MSYTVLGRDDLALLSTAMALIGTKGLRTGTGARFFALLTFLNTAACLRYSYVPSYEGAGLEESCFMSLYLQIRKFVF